MRSFAGKLNLKIPTLKDSIFGYLMISPFYLFFLLLFLIPLVTALFISFTDYNLSNMNWVGLENYTKSFKDEYFIISVKNTVIYGFFTIVPGMSIGLVLAYVLNKKMMFSKLFRVMIFMPYIVSMVAVSMIWLWIYDPTQGFLNMTLKSLGMDTYRWLRDPSMSLGSLIFMTVWKIIGYNMTIYLAGLQSIPTHLYEAAKIDGANSMNIFLKIIIPMLTPVTFFLFITGCIDAFKVFEQVNIMTAGGPVHSTTTMVHQIYLNAFEMLDMGYACSQAVILIVFVIAITLINYRIGSKSVDVE